MMAKLSEKYNDSCIKIFTLLKLLLNGEVEYSEVMNIFAEEASTNNSTFPVILNKYMNTIKIFGVKVKKVNTMNITGKKKRMGANVGKRSDWKKAIVTLTEDSKEIEFFEGI